MPYVLYVKAAESSPDLPASAIKLAQSFLNEYKKTHSSSEVVIRDLNTSALSTNIDSTETETLAAGGGRVPSFASARHQQQPQQPQQPAAAGAEQQQISRHEEFNMAEAVVFYSPTSRPISFLKSYIDLIVSQCNGRAVINKPITVIYSTRSEDPTSDVGEIDAEYIRVFNERLGATDVTFIAAEDEERAKNAIKSRALKPYRGSTVTKGSISVDARDESRKAREKERERQQAHDRDDDSAPTRMNLLEYLMTTSTRKVGELISPIVGREK